MEDGQDGCKDDASDKSQTSDLGIGFKGIKKKTNFFLSFIRLISNNDFTSINI